MSRFNRVAGLVLLGLAALAAVLVWLLVARPAGDSVRVLYLAPDSDGQHQLYLLDIDSGDLRQITEEPLGIQDFAVSRMAKASSMPRRKTMAAATSGW